MLNYNTIIDFFNSIGLYNEEYFNLIKKNTVIIEGDYDKIKDFIGLYIKDDLTNFKLYLPPLKGSNNLLIYIHEYTNALFPEDDEEIFPNIVESIFLTEYLMHDKYIKENIEKTKTEIVNSDSEKHTIGKKIKLLCLKEGLHESIDNRR